MNIEQLLKQLRGIEPERAYAKKSRSLILRGRFKTEALSIFIKYSEIAASVALAGVLLFAVLGGVSSRQLAPLRVSGLDPEGLKAEAQAIDIQIQLNNVSYNAFSKQAESTKPTAIKSQPAAAAPPAPAEQTSTLSVDEALQAVQE